jgi:ferredoxin-NADP reductase
VVGGDGRRRCSHHPHRPPAGLQFRAGQYLKLGVPGNRSGSYSIASAPHEPHLEFCVELIAGGRLSPALFALRPGDRVTLTDRAKGGFVLACAPCHLMVATSPASPLRSMLRGRAAPRDHGQIIVLHGASHADELPYLEELTAARRGRACTTCRR